MGRQTIARQLGWFEPGLKNQAKGSRTVANWDEDAITMAVAAARACVSAESNLPSTIIFASTTAPFLDRSNATLISEALSLDPQIRVFDSSGSQRAASSALLNTLESGQKTTTLLVAADRRGALPGSAAEMRYGDAATAVQIGSGNEIASYLGGAALASDFVDHYRSVDQSTDYVLEDRWVRDVGVARLIPQVINTACEQAQLDVLDIDRLILPIPFHHAKAVIKKLNLGTKVLVDNLFEQIGDTGVGHGLMMLDQALCSAEAGQIICLVGFGQGCDALLFKVNKGHAQGVGSSPLEQIEKCYELNDYLKLPAFSRQVDLAKGIRAEADKRTSISAYYRHHNAINAMLGSVCDACKTPHFPPARACVNCHAIDKMSDYPFADRIAKLKSFTEDWQTATPAPPMSYGNVEFVGGGNAFLELSDVIPGSLAVGVELAMQFRIKDFDDNRGFRRYFWKPVMLNATSDTDSNINSNGGDNG